MRALVTGATGFIGFHVMRRLLEEGWAVRVLLRPTSDRRRLARYHVEPAVGDIHDPASLERAVRDCAVVFHAAGRVAFWSADAGALEREHVDGTRRVAQACRAAGARLVYTSSVASLGCPRPDGTIGDESTPFDWDHRRFPYQAAKRAAEEAVLAEVREGLDGVIVLPATTFGAYDWNLSAARFIDNLYAGRIVGYPPGALTVADAEAVAEGHVRAATRGRRGERYVLGGDHLTYRTMFTQIARELGRRPPRLAVPRAMLGVLGVGGSVASSLLRRDLGLTRASAALGCLHLCYHSAKAVHELGYRPRPAAAAIAVACAWYRGWVETRAAA